MLMPVRAATDGSLQPFRFVALGDDDHRALRMVVDSAADRSFQGIRSSQWATRNQFKSSTAKKRCGGDSQPRRLKPNFFNA